MQSPSKTAVFLFVAALATPSHAQISGDVAEGHSLSDRWDGTATDGFGLAQGQATTLTWSIVDDGTGISSGVGEPATNSDLIAFLDLNIGPGAGGTDLTNRPWFSNFADPYSRWADLSGLSFDYVTYDDGPQINGSVNASTIGTLDTRADIRIGGHSIDGQTGGNTLAYNYFPIGGDMVIDTDNIAFFSNPADAYVRFRNTVAHEAGHGLGLAHPQSNSNRFLMEPFIDTSFDGPQHSDILGIQRGYGDVNEAGGANDTSVTATSLGSIATFAGIGMDGDNPTVALTDTDFVSIDGVADTDFYSITLDEDGEFDVILESLGLQYDIREQDPASPAPQNTPISVDTKLLNNLALALLGTDGSTVIATSTAAAVGETESILGQTLIAGTYFLRVDGSDDLAQFYSLNTSFTPVPEPSGILLLGVSSMALLIPRKRH